MPARARSDLPRFLPRVFLLFQAGHPYFLRSVCRPEPEVIFRVSLLERDGSLHPERRAIDLAVRQEDSAEIARRARVAAILPHRFFQGGSRLNEPSGLEETDPFVALRACGGERRSGEKGRRERGHETPADPGHIYPQRQYVRSSREVLPDSFGSPQGRSPGRRGELPGDQRVLMLTE